MANRVVYERPYDAEVEYLQSSGTQWIDTLYKMTLSDEIRTKVYHLENNSMCVIFGSRGTAISNFYQFYINEIHASQVAFGQSTRETIKAHIPSYQVNGMNEIIFKDSLCICNGSSTQIPVGTENSLQNLAIFARRNQDSSVSYHMIMKLYYFQIYHNGTLVRDFIPARKGLTGYLYDKVSKKLFANKGTGNFILGQDVSNPVPNIRRVFRFGNKRFVMPMPYDSKVEYLESTGTQWIDTGIVPDNTYTFNCKVAVTQDNYNCVYWGTRNSGNTHSKNNQCYLNSNDISGSPYENRSIHLYSTDVSASSNWASNVIPSVNTMYELTDITVVPTMNPMIYPITLFAFNMIGDINAELGKCRIGCWKCYSNGQIVRDFIPVRKGNIGYMYDRVSGKLFGNSGTGNFILGNDIN